MEFRGAAVIISFRGLFILPCFVTLWLDFFVAGANLTKMHGKTYFLKETSHQRTKNSRGQSADLISGPI
jgi:hypothetical protein